MKALEVTVRYFEDGSWGDLQTYQIVRDQSDPEKGEINKDTELARKILKCEAGDIIEFSKGARCLIENLIAEPEFADLVKLGKRFGNTNNYEGLVDVGWKMIDLISDSIVVPKDLRNLCKLVVSAHLTVGDVENALKWVSKIECSYCNLVKIKEALGEIKERQNGLSIENIQDTYTLNRLGKFHRSLSAYKKAFFIYERSLLINPNDYYTYNGFGGVYKEVGLYSEAIENYNKGLMVEKNIGSLVGLGATYRAMQKHDEAIDYLKQALELDEYNIRANKVIGAAYYDLELYEKGAKHFSIAGDSDYLIRLFWEYKSRDLINTALECLHLILRRYPGHREASSLLYRYGVLRKDSKVLAHESLAKRPLVLSDEN